MCHSCKVLEKQRDSKEIKELKELRTRINPWSTPPSFIKHRERLLNAPKR